jgi:trehalose/maltose hydrolase-like predicted phosphorylase
MPSGHAKWTTHFIFLLVGLRPQFLSARFIRTKSAKVEYRYFGTSLAAAGPFFEMDVNQTNHDGNVTEGWPLFNARQTFATIAGFFDIQESTPRTNFVQLGYLGWESVISGIPYPLTLNLVVGDTVLNSSVNPETISSYRKIWNLQDGVTQWNYVWQPKDTHVSFDIEYMVFISREYPNVGATQLRVTPRGGNYKASIVDMLDGRSAQRSHLVKKEMLSEVPQICAGVHPEGLPNVTAYIVSTTNVDNGYTVDSSRRMVSSEDDMTIGQEWDVQLVDGETAVFQKFIGVASSDKFESPSIKAEESSLTAANDGWNVTLSSNIKAWNILMQRNLVADYRDPSTGKLPEAPPFIGKLQAAAVVDRFIILSNLLPEDGKGLNDVGVCPTGLASDSYGGMIFWDQDLWIKPSVAATSPEYSVQIPKSRAKLLKQAKANAQMPYVTNEAPRYDFDEEAVLYSWVNGRYGNATATGPAKDYQYHLNTDVALSMLQTRRITGNETLFREEFWPVVKSVAHTITTLLQEDGDGYSIFNVTDPDEYALRVPILAILSFIADSLHRPR